MANLVSNTLVSVNVTGVGNLGTWMTKTGGDVVASEVKLRPGGMNPEISLGGPVSVNNITVSRLYDDTMRHNVIGLINVCGRARMTVTFQPLDDDRNPTQVGRLVYTGRLLEVHTPGADANGTGGAMIELVMSTDATVSA